MSFRGDDQGRYGHVPPVQYPVAGQQDQNSYPLRRPSFNNGDDSSHHNQQAAGSGRGGDGLLLTGSNGAGDHASLQYGYAAPSAMSGYQHQYHGETSPPPTHSYSPQAFTGRPYSHSQSLPYHPAPARYPSSPTSTSTGYSPVATSYTPAAYNPAAYANAAIPPQRQAAYSGGYNNYSHSYSSPAIPQASGFGSHADMGLYGAPSNYAALQQGQSGYGQAAPVSPQYGASGASTTSTHSTSHPTSYSPSYSSAYAGNYYGQQPSTAATPGPTNPTYSSSTSTSQAPYPAYSNIPVGPNYSVSEPNSFINRPSRSGSSVSPLHNTPSPHQQSPGLHRHPTNAPLPSRPVDDVPEEPEWQSNGRLSSGYGGSEQVTQASLMQDIEADLGISPSPPRPNGSMSDEDHDRLHRYDSTASTINTTGAGEPGVNRFSSTASTVNRNNVGSTLAGWDDEESDQEGALGVYIMQQAELDDRRFSVVGGLTFPYVEQPAAPTSLLPPPAEEQTPSDSDYAGTDLHMLSGGYAGSLTYGNDVGSPPATTQTHEDARPLPTPRSQHGSHDCNAHYPTANMDYGGTGGLQAPAEHRLSFDEGEERVSVHSRQSGHSGSGSPWKEDYPEMFYHPGLTNRPLPALPTGSDSGSMQTPSRGPSQHGYSHSIGSRLMPTDGADAYASGAYQQQQVERSTSMLTHTTTPSVHIPGRSLTDAAEERRKALKQQGQQPGAPFEGHDSGSPTQAAFDSITLPSGRKRKFIPSKLTMADIRGCTEPWALSGLAQWIREMGEGEPDLKRKTIEEGLIKLFTSKVPTMNVADAETLSAIVTDSMFAAGILVPEEEWVKFGQGSISGVLWQLTGSGCYAPKLHEQEVSGNDISGRCYSHHCTRTLKKASLDDLMSEESVKKEDWVTHYKVTKEMIGSKPKKEVERQNVLHEIVTSEEEFMNQLEVLRVLYRDQLKTWQPPIIVPSRLDKFIKDVFGRVDAVQQTNKDNLLAQLKYRQNEQGPWVSGFSDIFREWIRKARAAYAGYSTGYPYAVHMIRREAERNVLFRQFLEHVRNHKRSERLDWATFLKAPITRLQRYTLLLGVVHKNTVHDSEEKSNLARAMEEIKAVTLECDRIVDDMQKKVQMIELQSMLVLRAGFHSVLHLDHLGRELILEGELQRMGSKGVRWVDTHALLFDHYFILAKAVTSKDGRNDKKYDVSKEPIPMPLLFLESANDDPVSKQKGIAAPLARTTTAGADPRLSKVISNGDRPGLEHTATSSSMASMNTVAVTRLTSGNSADESRILYPFKVKHLGYEVYTLYAATQQSRQDWCTKIIEAKTRHARALHAQNAEPFRLRVLADGAFAYDSIAAIGKSSNGVSIRGTPLDRAVREIEQVYGPGRGPVPVCRTFVNCATAFDAYGKSIIVIGTDYGVYISEASNPRGWTRTVQINKVTQIAVLEEFSVCLIIADRSLIAYPLDAVVPAANAPASNHDNNPKRAPQRLAKDVSFFATARMKERQLLFYKRKEGLHNTFKVLEPVYQKSTEKKSRLFSSRKAGTGMTEAFRDYDEFYLPTDCFSLNLFQSYIAVSTAKGFELLTLDKKQTMSIPCNVQAPAIANIASRIQNQRPLGMFKLNDQEFLLAYEDCAVYIDKHGEVSRTLIMEYSGKQKKAKGATMFGQYLILFNEDYVEVRNAENGRLRQIIAGRDVRVLDYGFRGPTGGDTASPHLLAGVQPGMGHDSKGTVKICMSHPEQAGTQIVLEMLLNDGHAEKA